MNTHEISPADVLREFVHDVKSAYGTGDVDLVDFAAFQAAFTG